MIANTFLARPVTAIVISIVIVLVGVIALYNLPISQYPDITPPTVTINAPTNASTQTLTGNVNDATSAAAPPERCSTL